jgi:hypothetical protein
MGKGQTSKMNEMKKCRTAMPTIMKRNLMSGIGRSFWQQRENQCEKTRGLTKRLLTVKSL